jgi:CMP-N-acetylneuraminic acid synthetase
MSNKMKINVFLPCKKNSTRVENKNKRKFANVHYGLLKVKIDQLLKCKFINKIYLSTDDKKIINFVKKLKSDVIIIHQRVDKKLSTNQTSTQALIQHASDIIKEGHILWTHVTSPLIDNFSYEKIIKAYKKNLKKNYDSLMTVTKFNGFIWNQKEPINYNPKKEKWPKTQDTNYLYKVNSAVFISSRENYIKEQNRIGKKPFFYELPRLEGIDIDELEDFYFAEYIFINRQRFLKR